jgi:hypothetical protein
MSLLGRPEQFECQHEKLIKKKHSKTMYDCKKCSKTFMIVPAKFDPYNPPIFPNQQNPPNYPDYPDFPDLIDPNYPIR